MIKKLKLNINHIPVVSNRPRLGRFSFYVPNAQENKKNIRNLIQDQIPNDFELIYTDVAVKFEIYLPIIKSFSNKDKILAEKKIIRPITRPDIDNIVKAYMDAFNGLIWYDDGQLVTLIVKKFYSKTPRVKVIINYTDKFKSSIFKRYHKNHLKIQKNNEYKKFIKEYTRKLEKSQSILDRSKTEKTKLKHQKIIKECNLKINEYMKILVNENN